MNQNAPWESQESSNPILSGQVHMFDPTQLQATYPNDVPSQHMNTSTAVPSTNAPVEFMPGEQPYAGQWKGEQQPMYDHAQPGLHMDQRNWNSQQQQGYYPGGEQDHGAGQALQQVDAAPVQDQLHNGYCYGNEMQGGSINNTSNPHAYQTSSNGIILPPGVSSEPPAGSMHNKGGMTAFIGSTNNGAMVYPANSASGTQMDNVPLEDSAASSDGRVGAELPKLFSTDSFSNLPLGHSSFDNIQVAAAAAFDGVGLDRSVGFANLPTHQSGGQAGTDSHPHAHFLGTPEHTDMSQSHHSRHSSYGDRVNFLVGGSASTSGNPSATQSPYIFGHSGDDNTMDPHAPIHHHDNATGSTSSTDRHSNVSHPVISASHDIVEPLSVSQLEHIADMPEHPGQQQQRQQQLSQPPQQKSPPQQQLPRPPQQLSQPPQQLSQPPQQLSRPPQQPPQQQQQLSQQPTQPPLPLQQPHQLPQQHQQLQPQLLPQTQPTEQSQFPHQQPPQQPQELTQQLPLQQRAVLPQQQPQPDPYHPQPVLPHPQQSPEGQQGQNAPDTWHNNQPSLDPNNPGPNLGQGISLRHGVPTQHQSVPSSPGGLSQQLVDANSSTGSTRSQFEASFNQPMSPALLQLSGSSSIVGSDNLTNQEVPFSQAMTPEDAQPAQVSSPRSAGPLTTHTNSPFHALPRRHISGSSSTASSIRGGEDNQQVPQLVDSQFPLQVVPDMNEKVPTGTSSGKADPQACTADGPKSPDRKGSRVIGAAQLEKDYDELSAYQMHRRSQESRSRCITPATATLWADNSLSAPPVGIVLAPAAPLDASGASQPLSPPASCQSGTGIMPMSAAAIGGRPPVSAVPLVINQQATVGVLPAGQVQPVYIHSASVVQPQPVRPNEHGPFPHSAFHLPVVTPQTPPSELGNDRVSNDNGGQDISGDALVPQQQASVALSQPASCITTSVPTLQTQAFVPLQQVPQFQQPQIPQQQQQQLPQQQQQQPALGGSRSSSRQDDYKHYPTSSTPCTDPHPVDRDRAHQGSHLADRPSSHQQRYPDDRPQSRQQQYPDDRGRQHHRGYGEDRPSSRQGQYPDNYRPGSRQGQPREERSKSRQGVEERSSRPSSRQGYYPPEERQGERSRGRSRQAQRCDERDRSRSRQRYYLDDRSGHSSDRPHSRQDQYYQDDYSRTRGYYDDRRGYEDGHYHGTDRQHSHTGTKDTQDRSRQHYYYKDQHYKDYYYDRYYYDYYRDRQGSGYHDQDPYADRYSRGYYEELQASGQQQQQDPRYQGSYDYSQAAYQYYDQRSQHSQSRGSTPADAYYDQGSHHSHSRTTTPAMGYPNDTPNIDRQSGYGSRPSSRQGEEFIASPIYPAPDGTAALSYYDQSYSYAAPPPEPEVEPKRYTPHKFTLPHMRASFGASGQLVKVLPNQPSDGQPALVVIQDLVDIIADERERDELTVFPGPLIKGETHKNDVLMYCQKKARQCRENDSLVDRDSAELLWKYLQLLIKQNGTVVGADIADLLLEGHEPSSLDYSRHGMRISRSREDLLDDSVATTTGVNRSVISGDLSVDDVTDRFRNLLLHGQKKDALEWAIKHSLWGHALFLASKMDQKTHASVMTRFANVSMKMNDPLQTLYQLMSGRQPAAVTLAMDEKWGDWRPHLAMILSNQSNKPDLDRKSIIILGDTLAAKGCLHASHFCYLMASVALTDSTRRSAKLVLVGSSHSLPFGEFASNAAIQCTEVYEYAQSLGNPLFVAISFQAFKMMYAFRLLEAGMAEQALHYCEVIARTLLQNPQFYTCTLVALVYQFADRLKLYDPLRLQMGDDAVEDPDWLVNLHRLHQAFQDGTMQTISGAQTPVMGIRNGSTATNSEVGDILLYGQQHVAFAPNGGAQVYVAASQGGALVQQGGATTDVTTGQQFPDYQQQQQQQQQQPGWDPNQQTQQQPWDPNQQTQQQQWDPNQQTQQQQWDPNQQIQQQQWDPSQQTQQQQWDPNQQTQQQQWDPSQQNQQWSQGQIDNGYPGYQPEQGTGDITDGITGQPQQPPTVATPGDNIGQQGEYHNDGEVPRPGQKGVDLGASMNSAVTTTTSATDEDDESQDGGAPPGFDYYGMTSQPLEQEGESYSDDTSSCSSENLVTARYVPEGDGQNAPALSGSANHISQGFVVSSDSVDKKSPVDFRGWPAQPPEACSTPVNHGVLRAWNTAATSGGLFQFGVAPLLSSEMMSAGSSLPLGASASNFDNAAGVPGKQTYPGEEGGDKIDGGHRRQTYPGEETEDKDRNKDFYSNKANKSWFGSIMSKFARSKNEMKLPDDKNPTIVWDAERKRWVNTDQTDEEVDKPTAPPPKDSEMTGGIPGSLGSSAPPGVMPHAPVGGPVGAGPPPAANKFSLQRNRGARKQYVDVLAGNASKPCVAAPTHLFNTLPKSASMPANMFVPSVTAESLSKNGEGQGSSDVPTSANQQTALQNHLQPTTTHNANETHGELGIKADQGGHQLAPLDPVEPPSNLSRRSSVSSVSQEVQHYMQPSAETSQPQPPSLIPMMFNPAQFSQGAEQHAAPSSGPSAHGPRYGQRRLYPK